jgi:uncharacterized protein (TIGR04255 family)
MRRVYRKPPIVEATFECIFEPSKSWSLASPASLYEYLKADYPAEPTVISAGTLEVTTREGAITPSFRVPPETQRYQFATSDGLYLVRVSREVLSLHVLAPYPGWPTFRTRIEQALRSYIEVVKPEEAKRISLRYVNSIDLRKKLVEFPSYFNMPFQVPDGLDFAIESFFLRFEALRPDHTRLIQTFASMPGESVSVILDLDLIRERSYKSNDFNRTLLDEIDSLREIERDVFEETITDKLREIFDADVS